MRILLGILFYAWLLFLAWIIARHFDPHQLAAGAIAFFLLLFSHLALYTAGQARQRLDTTRQTRAATLWHRIVGRN